MNQSLGAAVEEYIDLISRQKSCFKKEKTYFKAMTDHFGLTIDINKIQSRHIERFQLELAKTRKASTVNRHFSTYCHFFNKCLEWGYIKESPTRFFKRQKEIPHNRRLWSEKDINSLMRVAPHWFKQVFLFLALTGARPCEACDLKLSDCDFSNGVLKLQSGKNANIVRMFPISEVVAKLILKQKRRDGFIFRSHTGKKLKPEHLTKTLKRIQISKKLERIPLYSLRHTFATHLCNRDVNLEKVRLLLGHSQIRTTQKYLKIDFLELKKIVNGG